MERQFSDRSMSSDPSISVTDVYDQAAGIAQEFDKLITTYGSDAVTDLMPKVIKALEQLETLASRFETESDEINGLRLLVDNLKAEKAGKAQERARFEQVNMTPRSKAPPDNDGCYRYTILTLIIMHIQTTFDMLIS